MSHFQYQARETNGLLVSGLVEADDRQGALRKLAERGLFPSQLEPSAASPRKNGKPPGAPSALSPSAPRRVGRISRKDLTAFTREMATLLAVAIPIPSALEGLGGEEKNSAL